ncbi:hypothetical protein ACFLFF_31900 [Brevibacillus reuszeri]|uniref:hypothetical protein n=1 Tax=Brevibacillus reuszeri TaxID=54915 RepID=UPI003671AC64
MKITKQTNGYILEGFHEVIGFEMEIDVLKCFLEQEDQILFSYIITNENDHFANTITELPLVIDDEEQEKRDLKFVEERTIFRNNEWLLPWHPYREISEILWYLPKNNLEIIKAMQINEFFTGIILKQNRDFNDYSYILVKVEDDEGVSLFILEQAADHFVNHVIPRLESLFQEPLYKDEM